MARGRSDSGRMESDSGVRLPQLHGRFVGTERRRRLAQARRPQMARCWKMTSLRQVLKQEEVGKVAVSHFPMAGLARGACLDRRRRKGGKLSSKRYYPRWAYWLSLFVK